MIKSTVKLVFFFVSIYAQTYNQDLKHKTNGLWLYDNSKSNYIALDELTIDKTFVFTFFNTKINQSINALNKINQISFSLEKSSLVFCNINVFEDSKSINKYKSKYANSMKVLYDKRGILFDRFQLENIPVTIIFNDGEIKYIMNDYSENSIHELINNIYKVL